ncbi:MAG: hypothetical protein ETSY2_30045 [Candidatus Entotheonella gemina]|uniref:RNA polymerase sigma factor n=1 Tax=Candidatus Entotheonella gemina TaxID=1429439 RepID=W4M3K2_9BACT|nr:MAG: hypothetical protein ETSY2_30045 [Candidatus Entotheonella gemina]
MNAIYAPSVNDMEPNATTSTDQQTSEQAWASLIDDIAGGDQQALGTLYDATSSIVYGLALRILGNTATAEEVTLDVYTQVWRQAGSYDASRGTPSAWLIILTRSRAIDRLRSRDYIRPVPEEARPPTATDHTPEEATAISERRRLVQAACAQLPPEQHRVLELAYFSGLSHQEIARQLDLPAGTVKTRIRLGMQKLRDLLEPLVDS